jgi:hypothetical protein
MRLGLPPDTHHRDRLTMSSTTDNLVRCPRPGRGRRLGRRRSQLRVRMVSSSRRARSAYPLHIRPITFMGETRRRGLRVHRPSPADLGTFVLRRDRPHALDRAHEGSEPAVDVVEDIGVAVRSIDPGDGLVQTAAVREPDRASLANGAPVGRLVCHLADRWEGGEAPREHLGQPGCHQSIECDGGFHGDESRRLDAVTRHGRKATR